MCGCTVSSDEWPKSPKAKAFVEACDKAGWETEWDEHWDEQDLTCDLWARRDSEEIRITWIAEKFISAQYTSDEGHNYRVMNNVSACRHRLTGEPLPAPRRGRKPAEQVDSDTDDQPDFSLPILPLKLPFDIHEDHLSTIIDAVRGRTLIWWNSTLVGYDRAAVLPDRQKGIKIEEARTSGRLILTFVSPEGWRSVALENLVQVVK
jgi:hypothetical protein